MTSRPNVLWISTHDINPHLGAYAGVWPGAEWADTPNLDRLAAEGARYDNAFASGPVCAPSRAAIITGCFPTAIGTMHMRTKAVPPAEVRMLPEYFREAGYFTTSTAYTDYQVDTPATTFDAFGPDAHWRDRPDADTPFFSMFHGMTTHESQIYLDDEAFLAATPHVTVRHDPADAPLPPYHPDTEVFRTAWARYSDLITEMDHQVGVLLDQLEEDGLSDSTIVVFWSDHGLGMPRAKRWATEAGLHEPLIVRWPSHVEPGAARGELVHLLDLAPTMLTVCGLDVPEHMHGAPFLEADGAFAAPANAYVYGGRDRMDEQEDRSRTVRDERFRYIRHAHPDRSFMQHCAYPDHLPTWSELRRLAFDEAGQLARGRSRDILTPLQRALVAGAKPGAEELYDVLADPHETVDLIDDPAYAEDAARLRAALDAWIERYGDLGELPEEELMERWRPGGATPRVEAPALEGGRLTCATEGAHLAWTTDAVAPEPDAGPVALFASVAGLPPADGRRWHLLASPTALPGHEVTVAAFRLGYEPSEELVVDAETVAASR